MTWLEHAVVGHDAPWLRGGSQGDFDAGVEGGGEDALDLGEHVVGIARLEVHAAAARETEQLFDEVGGALAGPDGMAEVLAVDEMGRVVELEIDQGEVAEDAGEQVVEIVGDAAGELADGLHFLRLAQALLEVALVGDVLECPDAPDVIAAAVGERGREDVEDFAGRLVDEDFRVDFRRGRHGILPEAGLAGQEFGIAGECRVDDGGGFAGDGVVVEAEDVGEELVGEGDVAVGVLDEEPVVGAVDGGAQVGADFEQFGLAAAQAFGAAGDEFLEAEAVLAQFVEHAVEHAGQIIEFARAAGLHAGVEVAIGDLGGGFAGGLDRARDVARQEHAEGDGDDEGDEGGPDQGPLRFTQHFLHLGHRFHGNQRP